MPRMAQPGTTTNLRRLAGRRSPATGGPHIPLESSDFPPVLFRLPEVESEPESIASPTSASPAPVVFPMTALPAAASVTTTSTTQTSEANSAEAGQNVFNHVAGAVTGAVAGTVANSVAVAGNFAGSALAATPFGTAPFNAAPFGSAPGARPSFSSAASSISPTTALETPASARSTPVVRPIPESAENDSRSWWEHWSSGIILMLLILALVTAGIMAIRDPEKSRNTQRSIADDTNTTSVPAKTNTDTAPTAKSTAPAENKPTLADSNAPVTSSPAASATLSPSLLPETSSTSTEANKSKVPSFTLESNNQTSANMANNGTNGGPALIADSSGFVSSAQPSPSAAASQGSASRLANGFANTNNPNSTQAISASTQIGKPQADNFDATVPATPADSGNANPNLSWPVEAPEAAAPANDQQSSATEGATNLKLSNGPVVTAPDLLPPAESTPGTPAVASTQTAPTQAVATRPAYLETSLPNEDLESILEMRRQAMANSRVVSNQYYASPTAAAGTPTSASQPSAGSSNMPTYNGVPNNGVPNNGVPNNGVPQQVNPQYQNPQYPPATAPAYQGGYTQGMTNQGQYPIQPNMVPAQQPISYPAGMNTGAMSYPPSNANAVPSQAIGTRSWTYNPNTGATNGAPNSWTLNQQGSTQPTANQPLPSNGGLQMDPNYARQLGYGQANPTAPNVSASGSGWSNTGVQNRVPAANNPYGIINNQPAVNPGVPNIAAPTGSMMVPNGYPTGTAR